MEEFLKFLISKRRTSQLSSDSSLAGYFAGTKETQRMYIKRKNPNSPECERDGEGDDIILSAWNMTEVIQKPL